MQLQILMMAFMITVVCTAPKVFRPTKKFGGAIPMVWVDGRNRLMVGGAAEVDTFFDRIVSIAVREKTYAGAVTGVLFTVNRVLTSFNAFVALSKNKEARKTIRVSYIRQRNLLDNKNTGNLTYIFDHNQIDIARPVIPLQENVPSHMKHGPHRPHHDLMVIRLVKQAVPLAPEPNTVTRLVGIGYISYGPILTKIANEDEKALDNLRFVSVGHISDAHIADGRYLEKEAIHPDDDAIADCDEWIPREWGRFICIRNVNNYAGLASGAMLFSGEKLVGVGAFALWKGATSALFFTDVRFYRNLVSKTCTKDDRNLVVPNADL